MPRLKDVADAAGVSYQTVSRVINNHPSVSAPTREKVKSTIAAMGYRRNTAARSLVTRRSQTIGVLASELSQYGPASTVAGVERAARDAGYFVSIAALREITRESLLGAVGHFIDQGVDGIILLARQSDSVVLALQEMTLAVPVVAAGSPGNSTVQGAAVDQRHGARLAVEHLIERGHRLIAHVSGPPGWADSDERATGWREALRAAGLQDQIIIEGDWSADSGYNIGLSLEPEDITALFVGNDQMALGVLRAFSERNIRVPEDISVVGFDDQPEAGYFIPPLTTVRQDFGELGRRCVETLLRQMQGVGVDRPSVVIPKLVQRASTGAYPHDCSKSSIW
ncbi:LacI family DNA-binding transcriptional regulator [Arthrobacter sp. NPDC056691]|uniref:LacI family DNA-binding transcriptional regulator n=1 Tax=unclassified Arthrobacter TaxID=235627 RepID=UPI003673291E